MDIDLSRLRDSSIFDHWSEERVRYRDLDANAHVNNSVFSVYCETARLAFRETIIDDLELDPTLGWVVAAFRVEYYRPVHYPGAVRIGVVPLTVGRTSFVLGYGLFVEGSCVAAATSRSVCVDRERNRPTALPRRLRARLIKMVPPKIGGEFHSPAS
jgi:acyl-CoA thioester hydrolase